MNRRVIVYLLGHILRIVALFMLPALAISLYQREYLASIGLAIAMALTLGLGYAGIMVKPKDRTFQAREGFVIVGLAWIAVSVVGALPFCFSGAIPGFVDSLFESVSGFTTTGASVVADVESLPMGLLYWRSFTHWLGGMGVLVFLLAIMPLSKGTG